MAGRLTFRTRAAALGCLGLALALAASSPASAQTRGWARPPAVPSASGTLAQERVGTMPVQVRAPIPDRRGLSSRLTGERLLPRVGAPMRSLAAFHSLDRPEQRLQDHALFDEMSQSVRRGVEREARRVARGYLLDAISLDERIESWTQRRRDRVGGDSGSTLERRRPRPEFDVSFHGLSPRLRIRQAIGDGLLGLRIDADGAVGLSYSAPGATSSRIHAGFDGDQRFNLSYSAEF